MNPRIPGGIYFAFSREVATMVKGNYFVYIITNPKKTVLYTGVTNNLQIRLQQHFENRGNANSFAGKYFCYKLIYYGCYKLIYYGRFSDINRAIEREKEIKDMSREKKMNLIKVLNPYTDFLVATDLE